MSYYSKSGLDGLKDHRRSWDKAEFEIKAQERIVAEREAHEQKKSGNKIPKGPKVKRELLKPREFAVDLESRVGKQVVINKATPSAETGGYYCDVCDCVVKDSINFLDHINGKNHQRNMGFSMRVKRSTAEEVRQRLQIKKAEKEAKSKDDGGERVKDIKEEEAKLSDLRKQQRDIKDVRKRGTNSLDDEYNDPEIIKMKSLMGISNFSSKKKR